MQLLATQGVDGSLRTGWPLLLTSQVILIKTLSFMSSLSSTGITTQQQDLEQINITQTSLFYYCSPESCLHMYSMMGREVRLSNRDELITISSSMVFSVVVLTGYMTYSGLIKTIIYI